MQMRRQLAQLIRHNPFLMRLAYYTYRVFQPKYSVGAAGVVINDAQHVLLVEHVFHPKFPWGLPGGWTDANEAPEKTVVRELREELGLSVEIERLLIAGKTKFRHIDFIYLCIAKDDVSALSYELLGYQWLDYTALPEINPFHRAAIDVAFEFLANKE
ncbi:MAG: NUDIX hydrolase [Chloroflexota bacterium]